MTADRYDVFTDDELRANCDFHARAASELLDQADAMGARTYTPEFRTLRARAADHARKSKAVGDELVRRLHAREALARVEELSCDMIAKASTDE